MTLEEAEERLLQILKQVMEEKLTSTNVEVIITINNHLMYFNLLKILNADDLC